MLGKESKLREEISLLKEELRIEQNKSRNSAFIDSANLPPCKSLACINCKYFVVYKTLTGGIYPLGCGKNIDCQDYIRRAESIGEEEIQTIQQEMLLQ